MDMAVWESGRHGGRRRHLEQNGGEERGGGMRGETGSDGGDWRVSDLDFFRPLPLLVKKSVHGFFSTSS